MSQGWTRSVTSLRVTERLQVISRCLGIALLSTVATLTWVARVSTEGVVGATKSIATGNTGLVLRGLCRSCAIITVQTAGSAVTTVGGGATKNACSG